MRLEPPQIDQFNRDGILFFPGLLSAEEMTGLREGLLDILGLERPEILREKHSSVCTICYNRTDNLPLTYVRPEWEAHSDFTVVEPFEEDCLTAV